MGKAKLGVLLGSAYALGLAILAVAMMALPCETLPKVRTALGKVPEMGHQAAKLVRVAVHAGALGVKHLPAVLDPQGASIRHRTMRFCTREPAGGCGSSLLPSNSDGPVMLVRLALRDDG